MKAYKVLQREEEKLISSTSVNVVEYKQDVWVEGLFKNSLLFCFATLSDAERYFCESSNEEIWEVEGNELVGMSKRVSCLANAQTMEKFWAGEELDPRDIFPEVTNPQGTIGFKRVKLIKKVL